jgi:hypothetical protein
VLGCAVIEANLNHLLLQRLADLPNIAANFLGIGDKMEGGGASMIDKIIGYFQTHVQCR